MASLSFARIMYGTNEDFHAAHGVSAPASASFTAQTAVENLAEANAATEPDVLGELLHRAWTILKSKS
jgi:hypothetical protein